MFSFTLRDLPGGDDPECLAALGMGNEQDPSGARNSHGNKAALRFGMVGIRKRERQGIAKNSGCFLKGYPMFPAVLSSLARVPFKIHNFILLYFVRKKLLPFAENANGRPPRKVKNPTRKTDVWGTQVYFPLIVRATRHGCRASERIYPTNRKNTTIAEAGVKRPPPFRKRRERMGHPKFFSESKAAPPANVQSTCIDPCYKRNDVIGFSERTVGRCGKGRFASNGVLTNRGSLVELKGSLVATLLDREAEQTLFDNRYDVPESVRPHSGFRARMG